MEKEYADYILQKTKEDYNLIADDYARTREFIWDIEGLSQFIKEGDKILDLGCGNGRFLKILAGKKVDYVGVDQSEKLIEIAKMVYPKSNFQATDVFNLPSPDNFFDKIFCVRAFHHIPSKELRSRFLDEARRVLKPDGLLVLTVWNAWQKDTRNFWRIIQNGIFKIIGKSKLDFGDAFVPWGRETARYYHFFTKNELKRLLQKSNFDVKEIGVICRPNEITKRLKGHSCDIEAIAIAKKS